MSFDCLICTLGKQKMLCSQNESLEETEYEEYIIEEVIIEEIIEEIDDGKKHIK